MLSDTTPRFCGMVLAGRRCNRLRGHAGDHSTAGDPGLCCLVAGEPECKHRPCGCFPTKTPPGGSDV